MISSVILGRYARSLAEVVFEQNLEAAVTKDLKTYSEIFKTVPELLEALGVENSAFCQDDRLRESRVLFEMSRMTSVLQENLPNLIDRLGPERIVFGTGMPFKDPKPALLKMDLLDVDDPSKKAIFNGNMSEILNGKAGTT